MLHSYQPGRGFDVWNQLASAGVVFQAAAILIFVWNVVRALRRGAPAGADPWDAWTLEWSTTSPPPAYNFATAPAVRSRRPLWDLKHPDDPDWTPEVAQELVQRAAGGQTVTLVDCGEDAAATIGTMAERGECDEILLSTPPEHHERWHHHTLPKRIQAVGIPVTAIAPLDKGWVGNHGFPDDWVRPEIGPLT